MTEKLVCNKCGVEFTDSESISIAKKLGENWKEMCKKDGIDPKGIAPCPNLMCKGELIIVN